MKTNPLSIAEALDLNDRLTIDELCDAADKVRRENFGNRVHTCAIVNARAGRCSEDCHWCAQSARYRTGCKTYQLVDMEEVNQIYNESAARGVKRLSLVTSGRRVTKEQIPDFCNIFRDLAARGKMQLCASMGLLEKEELQALKDAGVTRYHCNLEAAESLFPKLCTTHTRADKLATIRAALEVGLEVCSGGIIGMGETMRQRLELAVEARQAGARSIPVNILCPIPGTPLANQEPLSEKEVIRSLALMRMVVPDCDIFFAGGRARLSSQAMSRMLTGGADGAMIGSLLTTEGNDIDDDFELFNRLGYETD